MEENKSKRRIGIFFIMSVIALVITVCVVFLLLTKDEEANKKEVDAKQYESAYKMSGNSLENFDLRFLQLESNGVNKVYSPLSIKYALGMLSEGAAGASKLQIDGLIGAYKGKKYVNSENMSFANALFIKDSYKDSVKADYTNNLSNKYNAEIIYDSFENATNLNKWVSDKTFNLINNLYDDNISNNDFILTNALAIDMEWNKLIQATVNVDHNDWFAFKYKNEKFNMYILPIEGDNYGTVKFNNDTMNVKSVEIGAALNNYDIVTTLGEENIRKTISTEYQNWLTTTGGCGNDPDVNTYVNTYMADLNSNYKRVDTSTDFLLYDDAEVKVFAKDLKEYNGTTLQYVGIMPKNVSLDTYVSTINAEKLTNIINNLKEIKSENFKEGVVTKIVGHIPLFKFEYELDLMSDLKQLGITDVFDSSKANLSGIAEHAVISTAAHKANIEFSNEGIKAAAATTFGGLGAASCGFTYDYEVPVETIDLTFNNPYLFLIRDKKSGEVWFIGTVYNPIAK